MAAILIGLLHGYVRVVGCSWHDHASDRAEGSRLPGQSAWVVERGADRAHARAIRAIARSDGAEQEADRGAAQVVGRQASGDLTARLAGDVEQEPGRRAVVLAQAGCVGWVSSPGQACGDYRQHMRDLPGQQGYYRRALTIVRDHGSHDCHTVRPAPSGSDDNYR